MTLRGQLSRPHEQDVSRPDRQQLPRAAQDVDTARPTGRSEQEPAELSRLAPANDLEQGWFEHLRRAPFSPRSASHHHLT